MLNKLDEKRGKEGEIMLYTTSYTSPLGKILLAADEEGLTGVWFEGEKYLVERSAMPFVEKETPVLRDARRWLDIYFRGAQPDFMPPLHPVGSPFRQEVWKILRQIPYGTTTTYGDIAAQIARARGGAKVAAQAVGGAVGHNDISILIPCHRVVGKNGNLTGYAAGLDKKIFLLTLEKADMSRLFRPAKGTAL